MGLCLTVQPPEDPGPWIRPLTFGETLPQWGGGGVM